MRTTFLKKAVEIIVSEKQDFSKVHIVLPSRHAVSFFDHTMRQEFKGFQLLPSSYSKDDFLCQFAHIAKLQDTSLIFHLYPFFKQSFRRSFSDFMYIGQTILNDFNTIDLYCKAENRKSNAFHTFFENLSQLASIKRWGEELGEHSPEDYEKYCTLMQHFEYWGNIETVFEKYRQFLGKEGIGYQGLAYRSFLQNIDSIVENNHIQFVYFIGSEIYSTLDKEIFKALEKRTDCRYISDSDSYFFEEKDHPAAQFLNKRKPKEIPNDIRQNKKNIEIIQVNHSIAQAEEAKKILLNHICQNNDQKIAIVLPYTNDLLPLLCTLPKSVQDFELQYNILLQIPIKETQTWVFFQSLFQIKEQVFQNANGELCIDTRILFSFFQKNEALLKGEKWYSAATAEILKEFAPVFIFSNPTFQNLCRQTPLGEQILKWCFCRNTEESFAALLQIIALLENPLADSVINEKLILREFYQVIEQVNNKVLKIDEALNTQALCNYLIGILEAIQVRLVSNPTAQIHILSLTHTSVLDFDVVIMLSCNESILPRVKPDASFIPFEIRNAFGMHSYRDFEGQIAYLLFRLLKRGKHYHFLHKKLDHQGQALEPSRFLAEMRQELEGEENITFETPKTLVEDVPLLGYQKPLLKKDEVLKTAIQEKLHKGISITNLSQYLTCPEDFLYQKIFNLSKSDFLEDNSSMHQGTILHSILDEIFKTYLNRKITYAQVYQEFVKEGKIEAIAREQLRNSDISKGRDFIFFKLIVKQLENFLKYCAMSDSAFFTPSFLENKFTHKIGIPIKDGSQVFFTLVGKVDRIDETDTDWRLIDYKTGNTKALKLADSKTDTECLETIFGISEGQMQETLHAKQINQYFIQLVLYKYLFIKYAQKNQLLTAPKKPIHSGIYFLKHRKGFQRYTWKTEPQEAEFCQEVERILGIIVEDMLDTEKPFRKPE